MYITVATTHDELKQHSRYRVSRADLGAASPVFANIGKKADGTMESVLLSCKHPIACTAHLVDTTSRRERVLLNSSHMKVFPPIGLTRRPLRAAFISAYNDGLMPFFLHFFSSASLSPLVSKSLAFQSLLETDSCD